MDFDDGQPVRSSISSNMGILKTAVVRREWSQKAKLSIDQLRYVPTLIYVNGWVGINIFLKFRK